MFVAPVKGGDVDQQYATAVTLELLHLYDPIAKSEVSHPNFDPR